MTTRHSAHPSARRLTLAAFLVLSSGFAAPCVLAQAPAPAVAPAAAPGPRDISDMLESLVAKHRIPAMAAAVVVGNTITMHGVAGVRAAGSPTKASIDDLWHLGSCTKSMTATLAAILVDKKLLTWETTLGEAFPDLADTMHARYKPVTLAQLCTNRAGVPTDLSAGGVWGSLWNERGTPTQARRLLLTGVTKRPPTYEPGTQNVYSNGGFAIAGHLLETKLGIPYETLMQQHLFAPLGMKSCGWGAPGTPRKQGEPPDQPRGHDKSGKPMEPSADGRGSDNPQGISPAGRLHCTIDDWARFAALHLLADRRNPHRHESLLTLATAEKLHTPPDALSDYAFGWGRPERPWAGPPGNRYVLTHGGSNTMWFSVIWVAPAANFAVVVCCNQAERGTIACDQAAWALIQEQLKAMKEAEDAAERDAPKSEPAANPAAEPGK